MEKLCLHHISIHTNFHQNRFINEYARINFAYKWCYILMMTFYVIFCFLNVEKKDWVLKKKYIVEKNDFEILR